VLRLRKDLERIAHDNRADIKLVETPPGPPVLSTLVAEIYGDKDVTYGQLITGAAHVKTIMANEPFVTDIDDSTEADRDRIDLWWTRRKPPCTGSPPSRSSRPCASPCPAIPRPRYTCPGSARP
jgi:hypothetical protein